jgi:hypothetical protein
LVLGLNAWSRTYAQGQDWFNLVEVQRSANKIRSLPGELADMLQLRSFDCSNNAIQSVPYAFFDRCTKLVKLDLTGNQVSSIFSTIAMSLLLGGI